MANGTNPLSVHDIRVQQVAVFGAASQPERHYLVTYFIGVHGPFTLEYPDDQYSQARVTADILRQVQTIEAILSPPTA